MNVLDQELVAGEDQQQESLGKVYTIEDIGPVGADDSDPLPGRTGHGIEVKFEDCQDLHPDEGQVGNTTHSCYREVVSVSGYIHYVRYLAIAKPHRDGKMILEMVIRGYVVPWVRHPVPQEIAPLEWFRTVDRKDVPVRDTAGDMQGGVPMPLYEAAEAILTQHVKWATAMTYKDKIPKKVAKEVGIFVDAVWCMDSQGEDAHQRPICTRVRDPTLVLPGLNETGGMVGGEFSAAHRNYSGPPVRLKVGSDVCQSADWSVGRLLAEAKDLGPQGMDRTFMLSTEAEENLVPEEIAARTPRRCPITGCQQHTGPICMGSSRAMLEHLYAAHGRQERQQVSDFVLKCRGCKRCEECGDVRLARSLHCISAQCGGEDGPAVDFPPAAGGVNWAAVDPETLFVLEGVSARSLPRGRRTREALCTLFCDLVLDLEQTQSRRGNAHEACWKRLLAAIPMALQRGPDGRVPSSAQVKSRIAIIRERRDLTLWDALQSQANDYQSRLAGTFAQADGRQWRSQRAKALVAGGELARAAATVAQVGGILSVDDSVREKLAKVYKDQQPVVGEGADIGGNLVELQEQFSLSDDTIDKAIRRASRATASDASGWCVNHIKQLLEHSPDQGRGVRYIVKQFGRGTIPKALLPYIAGSRLVVFEKPAPADPGTPRPIEIGSVWRKLAGKALLAAHMTQVKKRLEPVQMGVGAEAASDRILHAVKQGLADSENHICMTVDLANAYNSVDRVQMVREVGRSGLNNWLPYVRSYYGGERMVRVYMPGRAESGGKVVEWIRVNGGLTQGDTIAPAAFGITLHPALVAVKEECPDVIIRAFLDDICLVGTPEGVANAYLCLSRSLRPTGLRIKSEKTCVVGRSGPLSAAQREKMGEVGRIKGRDGRLIGSAEGLTLLGVPIGTKAYVEEVVQGRVTEAIRHVKAVSEAVAGQDAYLLVRYCVNAKLCYIGRAIAPSILEPLVGVFDDAVMEAVASLLEVPRFAQVSPQSPWVHQHSIVRWGVSHGGLGIPSVKGGLAGMYLGGFFDARRYEAVDYAEAAGLKTAVATADDGRGFRTEASRRVACWRRRVAQAGTQASEAHPIFSDVAKVYAELSHLWKEELNSGPVEGHTSYPGRLSDTNVAKKLTSRVATLLSEKAKEEMMPLLSWELKARIRSACVGGASAFLNAIPSSSAFRLTAEEFAEILRRRLMVRHPGSAELSERSMCFGCSRPVGGDGPDFWVHEELCPKGGERIHGHDALVHDMRLLMRLGGCNVSEWEPRGILRFDQNTGGGLPNSQPPPPASRGGGDIAVRAGDVTTIYDVSVVSVVGRGVVKDAAACQLAAARKRNREKERKFKDQHEALGYVFVPLVFESGGAWTPKVGELLSRCARNIRMRGSFGYEELSVDNTWAIRTPYEYWVQRFSVSVMRWLARTCLKVRAFQWQAIRDARC